MPLHQTRLAARRNAGPYLRVREVAGLRHLENLSFRSLDNTRISPEMYRLAIELAKAATGSQEAESALQEADVVGHQPGAGRGVGQPRACRVGVRYAQMPKRGLGLMLYMFRPTLCRWHAYLPCATTHMPCCVPPPLCSTLRTTCVQIEAYNLQTFMRDANVTGPNPGLASLIDMVAELVLPAMELRPAWREATLREVRVDRSVCISVRGDCWSLPFAAITLCHDMSFKSRFPHSSVSNCGGPTACH